MVAAKLPADVCAVAARAARVPRVAAAGAGLRALGADRAAARPRLPVAPLRRQILAGTYRPRSQTSPPATLPYVLRSMTIVQVSENYKS